MVKHSTDLGIVPPPPPTTPEHDDLVAPYEAAVRRAWAETERRAKRAMDARFEPEADSFLEEQCENACYAGDAEPGYEGDYDEQPSPH